MFSLQKIHFIGSASLLGWFFWAVTLGALVQADTLDWDAQDWTDVTAPYSQTFTVGANTVTVAITGNTNRIINSGPGGTSPDDDSALIPGTTEGLYLSANFSNTTERLIVTVTFSTLVNNISFSIYDVDQSTSGSPFQDQIRSISATDGSTTSFATVSGTSPANTASGSGTAAAAITGAAVASDGTNDGLAFISFGSSQVNSFSFTWGSGSGAPADPFQQWITMSDIEYTVVPEPSVWAAAALLLVVLGWDARRRIKARCSAVRLG
jgi:hypothetical protein